MASRANSSQPKEPKEDGDCELHLGMSKNGLTGGSAGTEDERSSGKKRRCWRSESPEWGFLGQALDSRQERPNNP